MTNGKVTVENIEIEGRKIPQENIRRKLFEEQEKFMKIRTDSEYELLQRHQVIDSLRKINEFTEKENVFSTEELLKNLK